ncbi:MULTISPECIES: hypothetical protein [unclassified Actinoplanes]|uniref:hypothetical protein n=1 Tax=unclassified Actinoplanes TaxID=2626549 RepID=UPI0012BA7EF2|nr:MULTISPECIES: hypothetical protein [unclassified Actinoplanes]
MITLRAVVELGSDRWLELDGRCGAEQAALFVGALAGADADLPAAERIAALLAAEMLIVAGGLALDDTVSGVSIRPGCCAGLEDWRDWASIAAGQPVWLGHSPEPRIEVDGDRRRVWQDVTPGSPHVDVTGAELFRLLAGVQRDLVGFLGVLRAWGRSFGRGDLLAARIDRDFAITAPLPDAGWVDQAIS